MAKLKVVARVTRRAKEQAFEARTYCMCGGQEQRIMPAGFGWTEEVKSTRRLLECTGERSIQCIDLRCSKHISDNV